MEKSAVPHHRTLPVARSSAHVATPASQHGPGLFPLLLPRSCVRALSWKRRWLQCPDGGQWDNRLLGHRAGQAVVAALSQNTLLKHFLDENKL